MLLILPAYIYSGCSVLGGSVHMQTEGTAHSTMLEDSLEKLWTPGLGRIFMIVTISPPNTLACFLTQQDVLLDGKALSSPLYPWDSGSV